MSRGTFVVSLDFELYWGVRDHLTLESYRADLEGARSAVPRLLACFKEHGVHATWAVVGLLLMRDAREALAHAPAILPGYTNRNLCPFDYLRRSGNRLEPAVHFALDLTERVQRTEGQEIGVQTYAHFLCLEAPRSLDAFRSDLEAAQAAAKARLGTRGTSLVFPRNQYSPAHVRVASQVGVTAYRGSPRGWMYSPMAASEDSSLRRGARLVDAYLPIVGDHSFSAASIGDVAPYNVAASRFLRPWRANIAWGEDRRVARIQKELTLAAHRGHHYHLWWHPHNFGRNLDANMAILNQILGTFGRLRHATGMVSRNMREVAEAQSDGRVTVQSRS